MKLNRHWNKWLIAALAALAFSATASAQDSAQRGQFTGMQRVNGEVTAVNGPTLTIRNEDGDRYQVTLTDNTRIMKNRNEAIKAADLKVGDGIVAMGNLDAPNKTLHAAIVLATDAATLKAMKDNLGKTYISGKVVAIDVDNAKMTVERPDKVAQTIAFDETTSFKRGGGGRMTFSGSPGAAGIGSSSASVSAGESITLADIKVGDIVTGPGSMKSGVFVPTQLNVGTPGQGARRAGRNAPATAPATPPQ